MMSEQATEEKRNVFFKGKDARREDTSESGTRRGMTLEGWEEAKVYGNGRGTKSRGKTEKNKGGQKRTEGSWAPTGKVRSSHDENGRTERWPISTVSTGAVSQVAQETGAAGAGKLPLETPESNPDSTAAAKVSPKLNWNSPSRMAFNTHSKKEKKIKRKKHIQSRNVTEKHPLKPKVFLPLSIQNCEFPQTLCNSSWRPQMENPQHGGSGAELPGPRNHSPNVL